MSGTGWYIIGGHHHGERHPQRGGERLRLAERPEGRGPVSDRPGEAVAAIVLKEHAYRLARLYSGRNEHCVWVPASVPEGEEMAHVLRLALDPDTTQVTRFEVIDGEGRAYVRDPRSGEPVRVRLSYQDGGRTLKAFVQPRGAQ